ncbi:MAG: GTP pyrophosphokinase family protein [Acholeplasmatales bacterium]|nr:GTP pyrophosphokinase family protein [Acholeplasmatales bacterium]
MKNENEIAIQKLNDIDIPYETKRQILKDLSKPYFEMFLYYECAIKEVETKLEILDKEYSMDSELNPIDSIKSRVKSLESIIDKLIKKNAPFSIESIEKNVRDIAGLRVICNFPEDVYKIRNGLLKQDDVTLIEEKDYIKNPKENGYRSLHLIIETPIYLSTGKKLMKVEVQIRTIAENFWASLEHQIHYKKNINYDKDIIDDLKKVAEDSAKLDLKMQQLKKRIYDVTEKED